MTNKETLEKLLHDISQYAATRKNRSNFANDFIDAIESLEDLPFSVIDEAKDWQYRIETEGYVDNGGYEKQHGDLFSRLTQWVRNLIKTYC